MCEYVCAPYNVEGAPQADAHTGLIRDHNDVPANVTRVSHADKGVCVHATSVVAVCGTHR